MAPFNSQLNPPNLSLERGSFRENNAPTQFAKTSESLSGKTFIFPPEYASDELLNASSFIVFSCKPKDAAPNYVWFPCPAGITFTDAMQTGTIRESAVVDAISQLMSGQVAEEGLQLSDVAKSAGVMLKSKLGSFGEQLMWRTQIIQNPNQRTTFQGHSVRNFTFTFKFLPRDEKEAQTLRQIFSMCQANLYAKPGAGATEMMYLQYPPKWNIHFIHNGQENKFIPKIYESFLINITTNINEDGSYWHRDGSPKSISLSFSFQETRDLDQKVLLEMDERQGTVKQPERKESPGDTSWVNAIRKKVNSRGQGFLDQARGRGQQVFNRLRNR